MARSRTTGTDRTTRPTPQAGKDPAVIRSLVDHGDLSGLTEKERIRLYQRMCRDLGLNPATRPFAFLTMDDKLVLYATRGATDQMAAIHHLRREIIDGPKVITVAGREVALAVCRATHPDGRVDSATGACAVTDPVNSLMFAETKAKRRATLSLLGLGILDECEVGTASPTPRMQDTQPDGAQLPELDGFLLHVSEMETPGDAVVIWARYREELDALPPDQGKRAWDHLCGQLSGRWKVVNASEWLAAQVRRATGNHEPPPGP